LNTHNYEDFINFCKAAEENNHIDFDEGNLSKEQDGTYQYIGTYRDEENFKSPYYVSFNEGSGSISYVAGPTDCMNELKIIYSKMF